MGKKGKKPRKQEVEDFLPLTPRLGSPRSPTKNQLFGMITEVKANHEELKANHEQLKVLGHHWSRNDLILCATEILKWSVNLRGAEGSDGRQFFRNDLFAPVVVSIQ
jgi:hypothetical protein